ncbi:carbamoyl-phosphate synthase large subunit [Virgibacillus sp. 179-BFC.A HS]|uniref:Carbamoyl phosphate synthase large chain n=1 Tax=Tigheibacillus jepli TaxID=3035914 RepID=A0ABU5CHW7_9BACI|nr:carbamoyl-phosphate synthase large subunit [Virgibacillus sp. 179-BFC.A HS]MDY0405947.1 carbamoyl-phosphate synthase large subunit [Virgibacillus sp. 179-BFC.A HS]
MQKDKMINKILVIGSGPIVIGQAAEFDYSGTQGCKSLREEGYQVVLANSNPATIMTDDTIADVVYMEPLTLEFLEQIIEKEQPDALLASFGGQTALNLAVELDEAGILAKHQVALLGTSLAAIQNAEDREKFRSLMYQLQEPIPESKTVTSVSQALEFANQIGYPVMVRPAYTLGGTGGGLCANEKELEQIVQSGIALSAVGQCLIEKSIAGYKEIEFEVVRDKKDQEIIVCGMENVDPVGIHTGDSIVVAPILTLNEQDTNRLRDAALRIVSALEIEGACNVQLAFNPDNGQYYVIEVNPRVSRSSALASKATGYPIAKIAAKIAVGLTLDKIVDPETKTAYAYKEPEVNYVVTKLPRFAYDKFPAADRSLKTQMKATGEIMAIGKNFNESLLKGLRSLEYHTNDLYLDTLKQSSMEKLKARLKVADDERIYIIAEVLRRGMDIGELYHLTKIDHYFLESIESLVELEKVLEMNPLSIDYLHQAKRVGFSDATIARCWNTEEAQIYQLRKDKQMMPAFRMVDTFEANHSLISPYYYSTFQERTGDVTVSSKKKIVVIGSGPIRIGQGVEFDYATVHSIEAIQDMGYEAIIVNNNPETVSTDFSVSDKLYFEPLTVEDVMHVIELEKPVGIVVQFGGQTAINLAADLQARGVTILGTNLAAIDRAENRQEFEDLLEKLRLPHPAGKTVFDEDTAIKIANELGYPVLVRPSYVIGGSRMALIYREEQLTAYMRKSASVHDVHPILIDKYITGIEVEVDAISDGETTVIPGIMEHLERPGVHSGDSIAVFPPQRISEKSKQKIADATIKIAKELPVKGLINIQFIVKGNDVYVLEVNPRASRTVPFLSKLTGVNMAKLATNCLVGTRLNDIGYTTGLLPEINQVAVKVPVFSFTKLADVDVVLGPEMKSTGEVIGTDKQAENALYKGLLAAGYKKPNKSEALLVISKQEGNGGIQIAKNLILAGYKPTVSAETASFLQDAGIDSDIADLDYMLRQLENGTAGYVVYTEDAQNSTDHTLFELGRKAADHGVTCMTNVETAEAFTRLLTNDALTIHPINGKELVQL